MFKLNKYVWVCLICLFELFVIRPAYANKLFVFYPATLPPKIIQKQMAEACPDISITVFRRFKDFKAQIKLDPPDAILTKTGVLEHIGGYTIKIRGTRYGLITEPYVLLSVKDKIDPANISGLKIGVFSILDRKNMLKLLDQYFTPSPKLKRVTKMEDFLALLQYQTAKALLIPENHVSYFKERSNLNFVVTPVPKMHMEIIALAVKEGKSSPMVVEAIKGIPQKALSLLEVDNWQ